MESEGGVVANKARPGLLNEVDSDEQPNPHNVNEVPVVRHHDGRCRLGGSELGFVGTQEHDPEGQDPGENVDSVETGRDVETRTVHTVLDRCSVKDEVRVFIDLTSQEHESHNGRKGVPAAKGEDITSLCREHAPLRRKRRRNQDDRKEQSQGPKLPY